MTTAHTFLLVDFANLFFRMRHVVSRTSDPEEKCGMAIHLSLSAINQSVKRFKIDHVLILLEGRSWRKKVYKPYKANRVIDEKAMTQAELEENKMFWETFETLTSFLKEKTNLSVLRNPIAEADDLIARFIHLHPNDNHYILSTDTDFVQLIAPNVKQYNGVTNQLITLEGYFDDKNKPVIDKKTKLPKTLGDPQFLLFEKIMRGDTTDNIFSAYPGVRTKGSKTKAGLTEAFADKTKQGFIWNNVMLTKFVDHEGIEHQVKDDYIRNRTLIDLTAQPEEIKETVDNTITNEVRTTLVPQVGMHFMKFTGKHKLIKISEQIDTYAKWLNAPYPVNRERNVVNE